MDDLQDPAPDELEEDEEGADLEDEADASLDDLVAKTPEPVEVEEEEESVLELTGDERLETLSIRAAPKQANEFVCASCHLVKHNSQMADRRRKLCRDCV
ncbi:MAG: DUF4193 family protein [Actinomycetota bacterium]